MTKTEIEEKIKEVSARREQALANVNFFNGALEALQMALVDTPAPQEAEQNE